MKKVVFLVTIFLIGFSSISFAQTNNFSRNLRLGMRGDDILSLQRFLNTKQETKLADSGPGSPGNETNYFGPITKKAVIAFQNLYATEVLHPINLFKGTGFVGLMTRAKLNQLQLETLSGISELNGGKPKITSIFPDVVNPGDTITIRGSDFTSLRNTIIIGGNRITDVTSARGDTLLVSLSSRMPAGTQSVAVFNANGFSNEETLIVNSVDENSNSVVIDSIFPESGSYKTEVTVKGAGFTPTDNTVYISYDVIRGVSSLDGETLKFTIDPNFGPFSRKYGNGNFEFWFYVENINGSSDALTFEFNPYID